MNPRKHLTLAGLASAVGLLASFTAQASILPVNTGGANPGSLDPEWRLTATSGPGAVPNAYVVTQYAFAWIANDSTSKWISYSPVLEDSGLTSPDDFTYSLDFTSTSAGSATVRWLSDNSSTLVLDGQNIHSTQSPSPFTAWETTTISWAANPLGHRISINVTNDFRLGGNPTGVRVEFTNVVVPEPSTYVAGGLALLPLIFGLRSRFMKK